MLFVLLKSLFIFGVALSFIGGYEDDDKMIAGAWVLMLISTVFSLSGSPFVALLLIILIPSVCTLFFAILGGIFKEHLKDEN